jgi:hypothetical protein
MTPGMRALLAVLAAGVVIAAWMSRYDVKSASASGTIVHDRWTGSVYECYVSGGCRSIYPQPVSN